MAITRFRALVVVR